MGEDLASKSWDALTPIEKAQVWATPQMATELRQGAADEYVASLAEKVERGEELTEPERSVWQKIIDAIKRFFGAETVEGLTPQEIAQYLQESREFLQNGEQAQAQLLGEEEARNNEESPQFSAEEEPKPIGKGAFGNIYDQFRGKPKEAFDFLIKHKSGDLLGVFHRNDIGDIDLVWGDKNKGLAHIIDKHIGINTETGVKKDFVTIDDARERIIKVLEDGKIIQDRGITYVVSTRIIVNICNSPNVIVC